MGSKHDWPFDVARRAWRLLHANADLHIRPMWHGLSSDIGLDAVGSTNYRTLRIPSSGEDK